MNHDGGLSPHDSCRVRLGNGDWDDSPLLSEEEFARQFPEAYAATLVARLLPRSVLEMNDYTGMTLAV